MLILTDQLNLFANKTTFFCLWLPSVFCWALKQNTLTTRSMSFTSCQLKMSPFRRPQKTDCRKGNGKGRRMWKRAVVWLLELLISVTHHNLQPSSYSSSESSVSPGLPHTCSHTPSLDFSLDRSSPPAGVCCEPYTCVSLPVQHTTKWKMRGGYAIEDN